jgi:hypothetical protein
MTDFSELISGVQRNGDTWTADVSEDWRQGRTLFGGLCGALCLEAAKREFTDLPPLRSAQFALVGPAASKIMVRPSMLRRGKSTAFVGADQRAPSAPPSAERSVARRHFARTAAG